MEYQQHEDGASWSYNSAELTRYEETALRVLDPLIDKYKDAFCYDPESEVWNEFYEKFQEEFVKDYPAQSWLVRTNKEGWKALGLNTYANKKVLTDPERRYWQNKISGKPINLTNTFFTVLKESFPELIEDLDKRVSPYFFEYKTFRQYAEEQKREISNTVYKEMTKPFENEKGDKQATSKYREEFSSRVRVECEKRLYSLLQVNYKEKEQILLETYNAQLRNWFSNSHLCDEFGNPPEFLVDKVKRWITESYNHPSFNCATQISSWCSSRGTHNLTEFLNKPGIVPPFWAWPAIDTSITVLHFEPENFEFNFPAWLPIVSSCPPQQTYKKAIETAFKDQLEKYLSKVNFDYQIHQLQTNTTLETLERQIKALIHRIVYKKAYKEIANLVDLKISAVQEGVNKVAGLLKISTKPKSKTKRDYSLA